MHQHEGIQTEVDSGDFRRLPEVEFNCFSNSTIVVLVLTVVVVVVVVVVVAVVVVVVA